MKIPHHNFKWIILLLTLSLVSCTTSKPIIEPEPQILKPTLKQPANQSNTVGDQIQLSIEASNPDNTPLSYQAEWLPEGLSMNGSSGLISGVVKKVETKNVTISVVNDQNESSSATFSWEVKAKPSEPKPKPSFILSLSKSGTGSGTVVSSQAGIDCGSTCSFSFDENTELSLSASAEEGSLFVAWSGACSGTEACHLIITQDVSATAIFDKLPDPTPTFKLTVNKSGTGSGSVLSTPDGINCGTTCSADFDENTVVSLSAQAATGSSFTGWSGVCSGTAKCVVTLSQARTVSATFDKLPDPTPTFKLTVNKSGTGSGSVLSTPDGINCGTTCSADFDENTVVSLSAQAATGSSFTGWSGVCSGTAKCVVTLSQARTVSATFDKLPSPVDTSLLAYWKFDNNGLDETSNNNIATLSNASYTTGKFGQSLDLGGRTKQSYAKANSSASLNNMTDQLTVSAWTYPYVAPDKYHVLVSRQRADNGHPDQFFLGFGPKTPSRGGNGEITYKWHLSTTTNTKGADCYENTPLVGQWIHMVGTYDGNNIRLYVNGELICTRPISGNIPVDNNPVTIGMEENYADKQFFSFFNGRIDDVKMYKRALNASEIQSLYQEGN